jgi:PAS domain S-box-containing protein
MPGKLYALILEDTDDDLQLLLRTLRQGGYELVFEHVDNEPEFKSALARGIWDLVIADYSMPQFTALDALHWIQSQGIDIPFLIVSGTIGEELAVAAMKAGAHDYFVKGKLARLIPTIERELREAGERRERRRAEEDLRQTTAYVQSLISAAPVALVVLDGELAVRVWNPAAEALFGWMAREIAGQPLPMIQSEAGAHLRETLEEALSGVRQAGVEIAARRRDGAMLELILSTAPLADTPGGLLAFFTDVTQQKLLEAQYRQSQKMEAIGQLAGGVAHDFNNLLQVIVGYNEMHLDAMSASDSRRADLLEIQAAAARAIELTRQLLAFSRRQVLQPKDLNPNQLIANILKMLRRIIGEHIRLDFVQGHALGTIHADPTQVEQILLNLCINARDAMPGGGLIVIETQNVTINGIYTALHPWVPEGRYVLITVTDTGVGMPPEVQSRIFDPFFTTKEEGKGTGLGLATTYGIVKQHNGFIHVYSEVGKGTAFKIYLPITDRKASEIGALIETPVAVGTETILVAEDQQSVRALARQILCGAGYTVIEATDGEEALEVYRENADKVGLVLLDVIMPKLYGRAVYEQIRIINPSVRVLFCSGYSANGVHTDFIASEQAMLIQKPYHPKDLLRAVRQALDGSPGQ